MTHKNKIIFKNGKAFERKFKEYVSYCKSDDVKKLPNIAGFCCYCNIMRSDFMMLKNKYPLQFDVAMSILLDEAWNTKILNTGTTLEYVRNEINGYSNDIDGIEIICGHDSFDDGA